MKSVVLFAFHPRKKRFLTTTNDWIQNCDETSSKIRCVYFERIVYRTGRRLCDNRYVCHRPKADVVFLLRNASFCFIQNEEYQNFFFWIYLFGFLVQFDKLICELNPEDFRSNITNIKSSHAHSYFPIFLWWQFEQIELFLNNCLRYRQWSLCGQDKVANLENLWVTNVTMYSCFWIIMQKNVWGKNSPLR